MKYSIKKSKRQAGGQSSPKPFVPKNTYAGSAEEDSAIQMQQDINPANPNATTDFVNSEKGKQMIQKYKAMGYDLNVDPKTRQLKFTKNVGGLQENPLTKDFNVLASTATAIGDTIQGSKQRHEEKLQVLDSMTPKFFQNMEAQGLDNVPAYTMYGGDIPYDKWVDYTQGSVHGDGTSAGIREHSSGPNFKQYSRGINSDTASGRTEADVPVGRKSGTMPKYINGGNWDRQAPYLEYGGWDQEGFMMEYGGAEPGYMMYGGVGFGVPQDYSNMTNEDFGHQGIGHNGPYGQQSVYRAGGNVTSTKAKEILHDGTIHGQPITDKQRRYFGWIAGGAKHPKSEYGGMMQTGGGTEDYYKTSATLAYYKEKLNEKLKAKNPELYGDYFKGLQQARGTGNQQNAQKYVQEAAYNEYLSPEEVKKTLGSDQDYQRYLESLKSVNTYNVKQGQQPLYGNVEGQSNDPSQLNYGRRFASLQVTPSFAKTVKTDKDDKKYSRNYKYNPQTSQVDFTETGDVSLRPEGFSAPGQQQQQPVASITPATKKYGGRKYQAGGEGYAVGDEIEMSIEQIKSLKKQGYKIEEC